MAQIRSYLIYNPLLQPLFTLPFSLSLHLVHMRMREGEKEKMEMMLGKRPRPPMRRTTSMTGLPGDSSDNIGSPESPGTPRTRERHRPVAAPHAALNRWHSMDLVTMETAAFLRACGLCNSRLGPGRATFMYRGEIAFCSLECREQQMIRDERMVNCSMTSMKTDTPMATQGAEPTTSSETVAAV